MTDTRPRRGVDLSQWQRPEAIDWSKLAEVCSWVICRASYGTSRDRSVLEHVRHARREAMQVGLYHFFRPSQSVADQAAAFLSVAQDAGLGPGDIVPALDVETDPAPHPQPVCPDWQEPVRDMLRRLHGFFGEAMVYVTADDWARLGRPAWLLEEPLWVAHWSTPAPRTPGGVAYTIWQREVSEIAGVYRGPIDQDISAGPLPCIPTPQDSERDRILRLAAETARQSYEGQR